jgi:hypothetical protein
MEALVVNITMFISHGFIKRSIEIYVSSSSYNTSALNSNYGHPINARFNGLIVILKKLLLFVYVDPRGINNLGF